MNQPTPEQAKALLTAFKELGARARREIGPEAEFDIGTLLIVEDILRQLDGEESGFDRLMALCEIHHALGLIIARG